MEWGKGLRKYLVNTSPSEPLPVREEVGEDRKTLGDDARSR
jgi:hypothetical protein